MKDSFVESHRSTAAFVVAISFMVVGAGQAVLGAFSEKGLFLCAGAGLFCAGVLLFKSSKRNSR